MADEQATAGHKSTSIKIAEALGETGAAPRAQISNIVKRCGVERALAWLEEAERIEAAGGEMLPSGRRRRTKGGVFFRVVRKAVSEEDHRVLFPVQTRWKDQKRRQKSDNRPDTAPAPAPTPPSRPALPGATWDDRDGLISEGQQQAGKATTVKITVIGRPSKAVERQGFALLVMQHEGKIASMPKGIPLPSAPLPTQYIIYVGGKQWNKVKASLESPEDLLIVEGVPVLDPKYAAITVFATNTTTKLMQQGRRAPAAEKPGDAQSAEA